MKGVILSICIIAILAMGGFIYYRSVSKPQAAATSAVSAMPTIAVKDFAPGLPMSQKTTILIQTSDSSELKYIVPANQVSTYIKSLPEGYQVVSQTP